jgi:hypothetical protein
LVLSQRHPGWVFMGHAPTVTRESCPVSLCVFVRTLVVLYAPLPSLHPFERFEDFLRTHSQTWLNFLLLGIIISSLGLGVYASVRAC